MNELKRSLSMIDVLILAAGLVVFLYIYVGFFFPDRSLFSLFHDAAKISRAMKLFLPLATAGAAYLYIAVRTGRMVMTALARYLSWTVLFFLVVFFLADIRYGRAISRNTAGYHALLQLKPPLLNGYDQRYFNVVCLGGSTTEFRDKSGRDWPSMVEKQLQDSGGFKDVRFHNMGKQWYTSQHILIHYIQNVRPYRPQAVIFMENINDLLLNADFSRLSRGKFRSDYGHFAGPMTRVVGYGNYSGFFSGVLKSLWYQKSAREEFTEFFPGLEAYERNIRTLIALARLDGTQVFLMTQPNIYKETMGQEELNVLAMLKGESVGGGRKWAYQTALVGLRAYNDRLRRIAAEEKVTLIDLEPAVPKTLEYFYDDVHYTDRAYDLIADQLAQALKVVLRR